MLDPKTMKYTFVDTCFPKPTTCNSASTTNEHHCGTSGRRAGRRLARHEAVRTKRADAAKGARLDGGLVLDTNGNGNARRLLSKPNQPVDPQKDKRPRRRLLCNHAEPGRSLGVGARHSPMIGTIRAGSKPGSNPPCDRTRRGLQRPICRALGRAAQTSTARVWCGCRSASGHLGSFDRRKCKGPPERAHSHRRSLARRAGASTSIPGRALPALATTAPKRANYTWVDQHNTLGLGNDVPISTGNQK